MQAQPINEFKTSDLVTAYNMVADKPVKKFAKRDVAERRTREALNAAEKWMVVSEEGDVTLIPQHEAGRLPFTVINGGARPGEEREGPVEVAKPEPKADVAKPAKRARAAILNEDTVYAPVAEPISVKSEQSKIMYAAFNGKRTVSKARANAIKALTNAGIKSKVFANEPETYVDEWFKWFIKHGDLNIAS